MNLFLTIKFYNIIKQYDKVSFIHEMELQKRIDKAIEFIYENAYNEDRTYQVDDLWYEIPELLNILNQRKLLIMLLYHQKTFELFWILLHQHLNL